MKKGLLIVFSLLFSATIFSQVVISEIMYNPPESGTDSLEFVELYNAGSSSVNLKNYSLFWGGSKRYTFTVDSNLISGGLVIVAATNANAVRRQYNLSYTPFVPTTLSGLSNSGTAVKLLGVGDITLDSVSYLGSWYSATNALGSSLILCNPLADNTLSSNWAASAASVGNTINSYMLKASPGVLEVCSGNLPVTWLSFITANNQSNELVLNWQVAEYNVKNYVVEQSNNGINFYQLAIISAKGNGENRYSFNSQKKLKEATYYRLKQVDFDGKFSYSKILHVLNNSKNEFTIISNVVKDVLTVNIDKALLNETFTLFNAEGAILKTIKPQQTVVNINVSSYLNGTYFLRCTNGKSVPFVKIF